MRVSARRSASVMTSNAIPHIPLSRRHTLLFDGVKDALQRTFVDVGGASLAEATDRVTKLQNTGGLQVDVY